MWNTMCQRLGTEMNQCPFDCCYYLKFHISIYLILSLNSPESCTVRRYSEKEKKDLFVSVPSHSDDEWEWD